MSNIEAHTFPDTNDNEVKRQIKNLKDKFMIHNQSDKVQRLDYLLEAFLKRKLKNTGGGFGEVHYSVMRMLLLLQNCPTQVESIDQFKNQNTYMTKEEIQAQADKQMEELLKIKTEEDAVIDVLRQEWEEELLSSDDNHSSDDEYEDYSDQEYQNEFEDKQKTAKRQKDQYQQKYRDDQNFENNFQRDIIYRKVKGKDVEETQTFFGGMPLNKKIRQPMIKTFEKKNKQQKPKKFSINAFLDKYLEELKPPVKPYDKFLESKKQEDEKLEKEKQQKLKNLLGIRTFDEIQAKLSERISEQDLIADPKNLIEYSLENPTLSSYNEPLNLLQDYAGKQKEAMGYWHYQTITERQLIMDTILLMQQFESPTFQLVRKDGGENTNSIKKKEMFEQKRKVQLKHISPRMLQSAIDKFLKMGNIIRETLLYVNELKFYKDQLGMVFESFTYKIEQIIQRFNCELNDLQQIALLQSGQISKKQLTLNPSTLSLISQLYNHEEPLTLLKLHHLLEQFLFKKIKLIYDIMINGVMDFLILQQEEQNNQSQFLIQDQMNASLLDSDDLKHFDNVNQNNDNQIISANLHQIQIENIKPADRVTFLLNYLYLVIKNNQLLSSFNAELNLLKEVFIASIQPYVSIMADWVNKGELKDPKQEFFIKANPKVFDNQEKASSKDQWKESFIFRTVNLRDLININNGQAPQGLGSFLMNDKQRVEISIPIFLRPIMSEILSIGKSIKIVRYLDKLIISQKTSKNLNIESNNAQFEEFHDFREIFNTKLQKELEILKPQTNNFNYIDDEKNMPNEKLIECGQKNLNNVWDPGYSIGNVMNESQTVRNFRDLLNVAPFQWSAQDYQISEQQNNNANAVDAYDYNNYNAITNLNMQVTGIFQIPQIQRSTLNSSFASTQISESTPEKRDINSDHSMIMLIDESNHHLDDNQHQENQQQQHLQIDDNVNSNNQNNIIRKYSSSLNNQTKVDNQGQRVLIEDSKYIKLSNKYNYSGQELANYEGSMNYYQAFHTFDYLMKNPLNEDDKEQQLKQNLRLYSFKRLTVENLIRECFTAPIYQIHSKACQRFVKRLNDQCKLQQNIKILRQIFFMEAGYQMHQYATQIFKQLDKGNRRSLENLYMINGHFNECVCQSLKGVEFIEKMSVIFSQDPKSFATHSVYALDYISLQFQSDWPLEIILDKETIKQYNLILQQLMRIKRVNYVLSLKDYWIKPKSTMISQKVYDEMSVKEQIMYKNKRMLEQTIHQMQLFQKELHHFSSNLEYYLKTRAIQQICNELDNKLSDIQQDFIQDNDQAQSCTIDMDELILIHQDFLANILRLCLLDSKSKLLLDVVLKVLQIALHFRQLCLKYIIRPEGFISGYEDNIGGSKQSDLLNKSDDLGLNLDGEEINNGDNQKDKDDSMGRGLLRIDSLRFMDKIEECTKELNELKSRFKIYMQILIETLKKYTKKGVYSYLDEAFTRFNFNSYYMSRDREGLE